MKKLLLATVALSTGLCAQAAFADITVYSAGPASLIEKLSTGFTAETGIKVDVFQATTGKVMARLEAEAANPVADVVISASWGTATSMAADGKLLAYTSPNAEMVPDFLKTDYAVAQGISALAIAWNPTSGLPKPTDWADLTTAEYKDMVTLPDPAKSGSMFELVSALDGVIGAQIFDALAANGAIVAGANADALNPVLQGAKGAVFGAVDYISMAAAAKGETVEEIFPTSGTVVAPRPAMILQSSPQPEEAKQFIDYMLSEEGQAMVAATFLMPARTDIEAKRPRINELTLLDFDAEAAYGARAETLDAFAKSFGN
ncbi:iron(III) transport system substrate-binding protein [Rhodobacter sp. JA431]|uniref:ABC transporter substrate-binding protein n=1 Tax=Rhodobacter sp. JA431 TaxID=570013 RepID=UPI000BC51FEF|nr:ABC transporter substrate-binding protein [Rhodobacter sp. JA431]SOC00502.1 iron(III) transport system substrate-binding protein [Rhodobacter sp. JA431]